MGIAFSSGGPEPKGYLATHWILLEPYMLLRSLNLLVLISMLSGCYSFVPVELESLSEGETVVARVSREDAARFGEVLGRTDQIVEGTVLESTSAGILLDVEVATRQVGFRFEPLGQRVRLNRTEIQELNRREVDRWRTTTLVTAIGVAVGTAAWAALAGDTGGGSNPQGGGTISDDRRLKVTFRLGGGG
jgi:hypothetical protein